MRETEIEKEKEIDLVTEIIAMTGSIGERDLSQRIYVTTAARLVTGKYNNFIIKIFLRLLSFFLSKVIAHNNYTK